LTRSRLPLLAALLLGAATVFGFAPFSLAAVPLLTVAALFALWQHAPRARRAAAIGFFFGLGLFGAGVSWVYVALSTFGEMPAVLAAIGTAGFCAYLALFPAAAGWLCARFAPQRSAARLALAVALWALAEWLRGWLLSGFGWLAVGYAQVGHALRFLGHLCFRQRAGFAQPDDSRNVQRAGTHAALVPAAVHLRRDLHARIPPPNV